MSGLTVFNVTTLILDIGTILMVLGLMSVTDVLRKRGRDDDKLYFYLMLVAMLMSAADIISYLAENKTFYGARWIETFGSDIFYMTLLLETLIWSYYNLARFKWSSTGREASPALGLFYLPGIVLMLLTVVNFDTGWIFTVDANTKFTEGPLFVPVYVAVAVYFTHGFIVLARYRKKKVIPLWIFLLPFIMGFFVKFFISGSSSVAAVCSAITIAFVHLGSMNEITDISLQESEL